MISEIGLLRLKVIAPVESTTNPFKSGLAGGRIDWEVDETTFGSSRNFSTSVAKWNRGISISVYAPRITLSAGTIVPSPRFKTFFSARVRSRVSVFSDSIFGVAGSDPISCIEGFRVSPSRLSLKLWTITSGGSTLSVSLINPKSSVFGGGPSTAGA